MAEAITTCQPSPSTTTLLEIFYSINSGACSANCTFALMQKELEIRSKKRRWVRWVKIALLVYCSIGIIAYYLQEQFFFHPKTIEANTSYKISEPHKEVIIPFDKKTSYTLVQFTTSDSAKGLVLYF